MNKALFCNIIAALGISAWSMSALAAPLITENEAALPSAKGELKTRGIARGPGIKVVSPDTTSTIKGVFDLKVQFEPRGGNKIDPASIRVTYLKSPNIDLTPRLKTAISDSGIEFSKAEVPAGEHALRISVKDAEGRETNSIITINALK